MIRNGWIKLHRKLTEWEWYDDLPTFKLWMHLLLTVNWQPKNWHGIEIPAGGRITSYDTLAEETKLSKKQVIRALKNLKKSGEVGTQRAYQGQLIIVEKYALYQGDDSEQGTQRDSQRARKGHAEGYLQGIYRALNEEVTEESIKNYQEEEEGVLRARAREEDTPAFPSGDFIPPSLDDIKQYRDERMSVVDPEKFFFYYEGKGWRGIADWKATFRFWEKNEKPQAGNRAPIDWSIFDE